MLGISDQDMMQAVSFQEMVDAIEASFVRYENGDFHMPDRMHVHQAENTLLLMPCFAGNSFSTKLVSVFPGNAARGLPVIQGMVVLNNGETGQPVALLNGPKLTALRTAAVGSVGLRYLSPEDTEHLGLIGTGVQGLHQVLFACSQRPIKQLLVYSRSRASRDRFLAQISPLLPTVNINQAESCEQLVRDSQVIITATSSEQPVIPDDQALLSGKCFIGVGSFKPGMREFSSALFRLLDQVFIDTEFAVKECGDLAIPLDSGWLKREQVYSMAKLVTGKVKKSPVTTTCFKSVGMALFDLVAAELIYRNALDKGLGTTINL